MGRVGRCVNSGGGAVVSGTDHSGRDLVVIVVVSLVELLT
jgi:hypothetical protein